jgi:hypothetical protein
MAPNDVAGLYRTIIESSLFTGQFFINKAILYYTCVYRTFSSLSRHCRCYYHEVDYSTRWSVTQIEGWMTKGRPHNQMAFDHRRRLSMRIHLRIYCPSLSLSVQMQPILRSFFFLSLSGGPIHDPTCQGWDGMEIKCIDSEKSVDRMTDKWLIYCRPTDSKRPFNRIIVR